MKKYTVGSLYAGVGGICSGFINAGANVIWANEYDKHACITYRANFAHQLYEEDIYNLDPNELDPIDILTAGFPCQPFSIAGYQKGFEDSRGNHFYRIIEYINALKPKVVFLENVRNLTSHDNGNTFKVIKQAMISNGYSFHPAVLNTKDIGNIPQTRERIYMVSFRDDIDGSNIYNDLFEFPDKLPLEKKICDFLEPGKVEERYYYREDKYMYDELVENMKSKKTLYQWRRMYVRENKSNVCPTLTANMGTGGHNVPLHLNDHGIRKLTPRECFNFQGFSKDFVLPLELSVSKLYKQAGNSVSVPVIQRIALNIISSLNKIKPEKIKILVKNEDMEITQEKLF
jgi:DNA (cytosine-5)-methyltransferase 1